MTVDPGQMAPQSPESVAAESGDGHRPATAALLGLPAAVAGSTRAVCAQPSWCDSHRCTRPCSYCADPTLGQRIYEHLEDL